MADRVDPVEVLAGMTVEALRYQLRRQRIIARVRADEAPRAAARARGNVQELRAELLRRGELV